MDTDAVDLIKKLLCKDKNLRLKKALDIKSHAFFNDIDFDEM